MFAPRRVPRSAVLRASRGWRQSRSGHWRFQSTSASTPETSNSTTIRHFAIGLTGGLVGAGIFAGFYSYTPSGRAASKLNKAVGEAAKKYEQASKTLQQRTPDADEAMNSIREFAYSYVAWIPGGRQYVDAASKDWESIRQTHKEEADNIINDAYKQFQELSKTGLGFETASKAYDILADVSKRIANLSGDALSSIINNHPQLKEQLGGNIEQLQNMGERYGPEAKEKVDEVWQEVKQVLAEGPTAPNLAKVRKLLEEKALQLKSFADESWQKGLEEVKPMLEKNPKVKELVEENADKLKQGNVKELFDKIRATVQSGDLENLQEYVKNVVDKTKGLDMAGKVDLEKYLNMIPDGGEISSKLQSIGSMTQKHGEEGKKLLEETLKELKQVLERNSAKAKQIMDEASKNTK